MLGVALISLLAATSEGQILLPRPDADNTLQVFVLDPGLRAPDLDLEAKVARARELKRRIDPGGLYVRLGVALPYRERGTEVYEAAQRARLPVALLGGPTTHHTHDWLDPSTIARDLRNAQWLADGSLGAGSERERLWACPSIYAAPVTEARRAAADSMATRVTEIASAYPGVLRLLAGPMEHCLSTMGYPDSMADYSPWSVAQFRDWLTHRGPYGPGGELSGQGWEGGAAFADDPAPDTVAGGNVSLNERFGTRFGSWDLACHDPASGEAVLEGMDLLPPPGSAGFDAPRDDDAPPAFSAAWSEFREILVRDWAEEHLARLRAACPSDITLGAVVHLPPDQRWREIAASAAMPRRGDLVLLDGSVADILDFVGRAPVEGPWGAIVDVPYDPESGETAVDWLAPLVAVGARVLVIRAWEESAGGYAALASSRLEPTLAAWLESIDDRPLGSDPTVAFSPPPVRDVSTETRAEGNRVTWSTHPFEGVAVPWQEWAPFAGYAVSRTHPEPLLLGTTQGASFLDPNPPPGAQYAVRALLR